MFRSQDILKASVFFHNKDREKTVAHLHKLGIMQLIDLKQKKIELNASNPSEDVKEISELLLLPLFKSIK